MRKYRRRRSRKISMRRRYRTKSRLRYARRGVFPRPRTRAYPEVKYADIYLDQKGVINETNPAGASLRDTSVLHGNILNIIPVGTARNNRIGSKIHVKKIVIRQSVNICAFTSAGQSYALNSINYRLMVSDAYYQATVPISDWFSNSACRDRMINPINRRNYNVYFDKRYSLTSGYVNTTVASTPANSLAGYVKYIHATVPVNRTVEYTDGGVVKECDDNYTIAAVASIPNYMQVGDVAPVVACVNSFVRIYYTDN